LAGTEAKRVATKAKNADDVGFYPAADIILIFGISRTNFEKDIRPRLSDDSIRKVGSANYYRTKDIVAIFVARAAGKAEKRSGPSGSDPLAAAKLEQVRRKSRLEELQIEAAEEKRQVASGELLSLAEVQEVFLPLARNIRKFGDQMGRKDLVKGREVQKRLNAIASKLGKASE
jgi:hypothetical protein